MKQMDYLKFTATILCLITGILASFAALSLELDGTQKVLINFISLREGANKHPPQALLHKSGNYLAKW